jgi:hypothetical protein
MIISGGVGDQDRQARMHQVHTNADVEGINHAG